MNTEPKIIQGGMGIGVSGWILARASALAGAIGTISGTAVVHLLVDALQKGDPGGFFRKALKSFPYPNIAKNVLDTYFVEGGLSSEKKQKPVPMWSFTPPEILKSLTVCANYAFVWLAKEGHQKPVFVNYLEKIQIPHIYSILGAMLAGVNGIVMGAGIPKDIPSVIDAVLAGEELSYPVYVKDYPDRCIDIKFNPVEFFGEKLPTLSRPLFMPIVSSHVLAKHLMKVRVDGFIVETSTAGGHNAPPRGKLLLSESGEPIYSERDIADWEEMRKLELPFYIAGSYASPQGLNNARALGASGIQAGTIFALSNESGIEPNLKKLILTDAYNSKLNVFTSITASPTGFPFKLLSQNGTLFEPDLYDSRVRVCNMGYLRDPVWNGEKIIFRCSAEPVSDYLKKGGDEKDTVGRMCLCNALGATVGSRAGEMPVVTSGDDLSFLKHLMESENDSYSAKDAIDYLLGT